MTPANFLAGKVALVTGASSGTGVDIAKELARCGARVAVHYRRSRDGADAAVAAIRDAGGDATAFQADLAVSDDVGRLVDDVTAAMGAPGVLVNNAGPFADTAFRTLAERDWNYVMDANLKSVFLASQRVLPGMEALGWGRIVNIGATSGLVRWHSVYGLAKAALLHLTESMAVEFAPRVTVNAVVPSQIASGGPIGCRHTRRRPSRRRRSGGSSRRARSRRWSRSCVRRHSTSSRVGGSYSTAAARCRCFRSSVWRWEPNPSRGGLAARELHGGPDSKRPALTEWSFEVAGAVAAA